MSPETKICKNCTQEFTVAPEDFVFYERVKVPAPNFCPACRMQRRLAHRNERTLYRRNCDLCRKSMVAIYPAGTPWPVYCAPCWWGDQWDAKRHALDYAPTRPFWEQYKELQAKVPRIGLLCINSVNSEYTNNSADNKNCYLLCAAERNEDCYYGRLVQGCRDVMDGAWVYDSEKCYECIDCHKCFQCFWSERCQTSSDLWFCFDVRDSTNCMLSTNLRHASYMIENVQYTKEEYATKKAELLGTPENIKWLKAKFKELKSKAIVKYAYITKCEKSTGDYLFNCHTSRRMFDTRNAKDCAYMADAEEPIDCQDGNNVYYKPELCYNLMGVLQCYNSKNCSYVFHCSDMEYSDSCHNSTTCFGSIGLRKAQYCILNKEYPPEEYAKVTDQIREELKAAGTYGNYLPPELSPFGYNETLAQDYFPLSAGEAGRLGFRWQEATTGTYGKADPAQHIYTCEVCTKNFRLTPEELSFYTAHGLPFPTMDFECRHQARVGQRTPRNLWQRKCMKSGCENEFETSYAPDRPETVYCERCYQEEVI